MSSPYSIVFWFSLYKKTTTFSLQLDDVYSVDLDENKLLLNCTDLLYNCTHLFQVKLFNIRNSDLWTNLYFFQT